MILITGASGYIGRHLVARLVEQGERPRFEAEPIAIGPRRRIDSFDLDGNRPGGRQVVDKVGVGRRSGAAQQVIDVDDLQRPAVPRRGQAEQIEQRQRVEPAGDRHHQRFAGRQPGRAERGQEGGRRLRAPRPITGQ